MEGGGDAEEDECAEARGVILRRLPGAARTKLAVPGKDLGILRAIGDGGV